MAGRVSAANCGIWGVGAKYVSRGRNVHQGEESDLVKRNLFSQPQSSTQKGVHTHPLTAWERKHWFLKHWIHFIAANFGRQ